MSFLGIRLVFHGSRLVFMVLGGFLWFQLGFHGFHGSRIVLMVLVFHDSRFHGFLWFQVDFHGSRLVFHGSRWVFMGPGGFP